MNTGAAPPPQSLSRRRGLSCLPLEPPRFPTLRPPRPPSPAAAFRRPFPPRKRNRIVCPLSRTSTLSVSLGKVARARVGGGGGWQGRSSESLRARRAHLSSGWKGWWCPCDRDLRPGSTSEGARKKRVGGEPLGGPGVSGGAFTNGSYLSASHTRPLPLPLRHVLYVTVVVTELGGKAPPQEPGFRSVASAGWGSACPLGLAST